MLLASSHCGQTPLLAALFKAGADLNAKAAGGATPAMMAEISKCSANLEVLRAAKPNK